MMDRRQLRNPTGWRICPRWLALGVVALLGATLPGDGHAYEGSGALRFWTDCAVFRMATGSSNGYAEFYFEIKRVDLTFRRVDDRLRADVHTWVHVSDSAGVPVDSVGGAFIAVVGDSAEVADEGYTLFFARALELRPGAYRARVVLTDLATKKASETEFPFRVVDFNADGLLLSDVELGYDVREVAPDTVMRPYDVLVKNQYKVYPDCRALVGATRPRLFFYFEAYNLSYDPTRNDLYNVEFTLVPTDGSSVRTLGVQSIAKPGTSAVLAKSVGVRDLPTGLYRLRATITDPVTAQAATVEKPFQVVSPPADTLTQDDIQRLRDIITYIGTPSELTAFESLGSVGKRNFMVRFWQDRDPSPGTPVNEFRDEHLRRMNHANERFSVGFRERNDGWRTDRGRVYVVYGPPDHIERWPFTSDRPAAERWNYEQLPAQGAVFFLFVDEGGYGDYNLVHSNARGERRDPAWERILEEGAFDSPR
ncbi:MAG: GWxTD domain-containing protein [Candidatus Zixiibacteriota bacterium]